MLNLKFKWSHYAVKWIFPLILGYSQVFFSQSFYPKNSDFYYEISPIYGFKKGIVSLTFDDGTINQFGIALPMLTKVKIPATFYLITNDLDTTTKRLISKHITEIFEIGSHTIHHPNLTKISKQDLTHELLDSKKYLKEYYGPKAGFTMAYPWGQYNNEVVQSAKKYYLAARSANIGFNSVSSPERFVLKMQCFDKNTDTIKANSWVKYAEKKQLWLIEMFHGIDNIGHSPVQSSTFLAHLKFLKNNENGLWYATVSNVIKYIDESSHAYIECENCSDSIYVFRIDDNLNNFTYNHPVSVKLRVPLTWDSIYISNQGLIRTEVSNGNKYVLFNAVPDNRLLILKPGIIHQQNPVTGIKKVSVYENLPFNNVKISLEIDNTTKVNISIIDMTGRVLYNRIENDANGVLDFDLDLSGFSKGIYFLRISDNKGKPIIRKFCKPI